MIKLFGHMPDQRAKIKFSAPRKPKTVRTKFRDRDINNRYALKYEHMLDNKIFGTIAEELKGKKFKNTSALELFLRESGFSLLNRNQPTLEKNGRSYSSDKLSAEIIKVQERKKFFSSLNIICNNLSEEKLDEFFQNLPLADRNNILKDGRVVLHCRETNENFYAAPDVVRAVERVIIKRAYQSFENELVTDEILLQKHLSEKNIAINNSFPNEIIYNGHKIITQFSDGFSRRYNEYLVRLKYTNIMARGSVHNLNALKQEFATEALSLDIAVKEITFKGSSYKISEPLEKFIDKLQRKEFLEESEKVFEANKNCRSIEDLTKSMNSAGISLLIIERTLVLKNQKFSINASARCVEIYNSVVRNIMVDAVVSKAEHLANSLSENVSRSDFAKSLESSGIYMNVSKTQLLFEKDGKEIPAGPRVRDFLSKIKRREDVQSIISQADDIAEDLTDLSINSLISGLAEAGITMKIENSVLYLSKNELTTIASSGFRSRCVLIKSLEHIKTVIENPYVEYGELKTLYKH